MCKFLSVLLKLTKHIGFCIAICLVLNIYSSPAKSAIELDITQGHIEPLPIAIPEFGGTTRLSSEITDLIVSDLRQSGLFRPLDPKSFIETDISLQKIPRFGDWRIINSQALVTGSIDQNADGQLGASFRLWDVFAESELIGQQYFTTPENWRRLAHKIADAIYEKLTGERGYFNTQIVYVEESGTKDRRVKRLAIMDQDGANHRYLTNGQDLVISPRISPSNNEIAYMSFRGREEPKVYLLDIENGTQDIVGNFTGMTFSPRFSPDGRYIIMSLQDRGNASLFRMNVLNQRIDRLTDSGAIDTSPSYSPDSKNIVFESDRGGSQQLYVMDADGGQARRISFGQGRYATPVWSPRGDLIAFTKQHEGRFMIGVMKTDGSGERILTEGYHNEAPAWSPNGRVLIFFREVPGVNGGPQLWTVDLTGYNERRVETPNFGSDPAWSYFAE